MTTAHLLAQVEEPFVVWSWVWDHVDDIRGLVLEHLKLTFLAVAIGFAISLPLSVYAYRHRWFYTPLTWVTGLLYTIPSLALFTLLIPLTHLSTTTAEIALVSYTLLILIRNTVAGLRGVDADTKEAAVGMGYSRRQLLWRIELPMALPAIVAGLRIATVTTIGLVTVAALIGQGGLGLLILRGLQIDFTTEIVLGAGLSLLLAIAIDGVLVVGQRVLSPWARRRGRAAA